ncbi:MAG: DUF1806 family protein [Thermaerobacterales bacterium]
MNRAGIDRAGRQAMEPIQWSAVQDSLNAFSGAAAYLHLETTRGAYTKSTFGAFARNVPIQFSRAHLAGEGPYRVGLKLDQGWIYAEGLTHWELDACGRLLLAGHDEEGRLTVALQLSRSAFSV